MKVLENIDFLIADDVNRSNIKSLLRMVESESISHAYLFYGNNSGLLLRFALNFAAAINCPDNGCGDCPICRNTIKGVYPNLLVIEPEGNILRKEEILRLQKFMGLSSYNPGKKICIITESELMNQEAANRLLKTLEDPPDNDSVFILLTEDISAMLPTIVSRCLVYNWNIKLHENGKNAVNFEAMDKYLNEGIRNMLAGAGEKIKKPAAYLNMASKLVEILKKMEAAVKADLEKEIVEIKQSDFDKSDIKKYTGILKSKHKRKVNKFHILAISRIFDIISAWLGDILAVKFGAGESGLYYRKNYNFIYDNVGSVKIKRVFSLMEKIEYNRNYLNYSINSELALDNIFLKFGEIFG
jgi:DNA polymerase III subunit delta'